MMSAGAIRPPNSSCPRRCTGRANIRRVQSVSCTPSRPNSRAPAFTGGNGEKRASSNGSRMRCQCSNSRIQASPSPGWSSSRPFAVCSTSRWSTAARSASGLRRCATTAGACAQRSPWRSSSSAAEHRRRRGERVERAVHVVDVALDPPLGLHRPADLVGGLEHDDVPAGIGQGAGGHEPVGARPDDNGVRDLLLHEPIVPRGKVPMHLPAGRSSVARDRCRHRALAARDGSGRPAVVDRLRQAQGDDRRREQDEGHGDPGGDVRGLDERVERAVLDALRPPAPAAPSAAPDPGPAGRRPPWTTARPSRPAAPVPAGPPASASRRWRRTGWRGSSRRRRRRRRRTPGGRCSAPRSRHRPG